MALWAARLVGLCLAVSLPYGHAHAYGDYCFTSSFTSTACTIDYEGSPGQNPSAFYCVTDWGENDYPYMSLCISDWPWFNQTVVSSGEPCRTTFGISGGDGCYAFSIDGTPEIPVAMMPALIAATGAGVVYVRRRALKKQ